MGGRWTAEQVIALAADASSVIAGRALAVSHRWTAAGASTRPPAVWGQCAGPGRAPYQTIVDLGRPAYRCSCPSRKLPCKHAIALLLLWADEQVPEQAEPDVAAAAWLATRAERRQRADSAQKGDGPADPVAAVKRAEQRAARVAAGVNELRQWLGDCARTGLAGWDRAGYGPADAVAARLVDAQAPGLANWVRNLPGVAASGDGWPNRLLTELALLHLLTAAHERAHQLPPGLASTVRSRVGYPVRTKDVLETEPVRDFWNVLSLDDDLQERLTVRRVQLHGARSGRGAIVLSFSAGGQPLDSSLLPGTCIDADLHFYPAALPSRALVGERYSEPGPLMHTGGLSIDQAVAAWARALAADPWTNEVPMVLRDVVPVPPADANPGRPSGWMVRDQTSKGLRLRPSQGLWTLLSISGGHPVTLVAGYTAHGLRASAVRVDDRMVPL